MKKTLLTLIMGLFLLSSCSDGSEAVQGAWKTEKKDLRGKPYTLILEQGKLNTGSDSINVKIEKDGDTYLIKRTDNDYVVFKATVINNDTVVFDNWVRGKLEYNRATPEEVKAIEAAPNERIKPTPDPF